MTTTPILATAALLAAPFAATTAFDSAAQCGQCGSKAKATLASNEKASDKKIVETALEAGRFDTLARLLTEAELVEALQGEGPFTVFAPTDAAFAKLAEENEGILETLLDEDNRGLLKSVLTYHVVSGKVLAKDVVKLSNAATLGGQRVDVTVEEGTVSIDDAVVKTTDIVCSNGVIHVIDSVLMPETRNIVEVAAGAGTFETLLAAAKAAGLAKALTGEGPYTVFAPTDDAFAKLPKGTVEALLKPENKDRLAAILKLHVVEGRVFADQAAKLDEAKTLGGETVAISIGEEHAKVGDANIVKTDIEASNGVVHVIDAVLLP